MIELEKRYPSGRLSVRRVEISRRSNGQYLVSVTGSEVATLHDTLSEAVEEQARRIGGLEAAGWRAREGEE